MSEEYATININSYKNQELSDTVSDPFTTISNELDNNIKVIRDDVNYIAEKENIINTNSLEILNNCKILNNKISTLEKDLEDAKQQLCANQQYMLDLLLDNHDAMFSKLSDIVILAAGIIGVNVAICIGILYNLL